MSSKEYYQKNRDILRVKARERARKPEAKARAKERMKVYYQENKVRLNEYSKMNNKKYYIDNREKLLLKAKKYYIDNREKLLLKSRTYHRNKPINPMKHYHNWVEIGRLCREMNNYIASKYECACGKSKVMETINGKTTYAYKERTQQQRDIEI